MFPLLDVLQVVLQSIAITVFNVSYLFVIVVIYILYKRSSNISIYSAVEKKNAVIQKIVETLLQGIVMGTVGSLFVTFIGLPIVLSPYILFLLPIAIFLSLIHLRYFCFSYAATLLGFIALLCNGQEVMGIVIPNIHLDISGLIGMVGILHLMEAGLIFMSGADDGTPVVLRQNEKVVGGYLMQRFWPLPFALLVLEAASGNIGGTISMPDWWPLMVPSSPFSAFIYTLLPITAALGYGNIAVSAPPQRKARYSALYLMLYSIIMVCLAILSSGNRTVQILGLIAMSGLHEFIIIVDQKKERNSAPFFFHPQKGIRILDVVPKGAADQMGIEPGDILRSINGTIIRDYAHLMKFLRTSPNYIWIEIIRNNKKRMVREGKSYPKGISNLGIIHLPKNPTVVYDLERMQGVSIIQRIWRNKKKS